ncbi:MAG: DUF4136 domain-containing protein [Bacteroidetes bacterium]|nr:DUF4136 domain-containing protein [Bacteroidota bacterium]
MNVLSISLLAFLLISCGATVGVDYEKDTEWNQYESYAFYPEIESGLSELDDKRVKNAVDSVFKMRVITPSETPQFLINFYAQQALSNARNTIGIGLGGGGGNVGVGGGIGIPIGGRVIQQQLTIDFVDVATDELIWQAVIDAELKERATPKQKEAHYFNLIQKALKKFPPK